MKKSVILTKNDVSEWWQVWKLHQICKLKKKKVCSCELQAEQMFGLEGKLN